VGHWGTYDVGWGSTANSPVANTWHHFVYSYAGAAIVSIYVDSVLATNRTIPGTLRTWANEAILVGAQRSVTNGVPNSLF